MNNQNHKIQDFFLCQQDTDFLRYVADSQSVFYNNKRDLSSVDEKCIRNYFQIANDEELFFGWIDDINHISDSSDGIIFTTAGLHIRYIWYAIISWQEILDVQLSEEYLLLCLNQSTIGFPLTLFKSSSDEDADTFYTQMEALVFNLMQFAKKQVHP